MSVSGRIVATAGPGRSLGTELLLNRLRAVVTLAPTDVDLILSLAEQPKVHPAGTMLCPREDGSPHARLIVSGWCCRPRILHDGRRQMLDFLLPGDLVGDRGQRRPLALNPVVTLTPVRTLSITRLIAAMEARPDEHAALVEALARFERLEDVALLDHVVRLGCQSALERMAHLLLELHQRLGVIGFVHDGSFSMPLTQDTLGELLGLSLVHTNRIVAHLRREKLATIRAGIVTVHDFARVALLADRANPAHRQIL